MNDHAQVSVPGASGLVEQDSAVSSDRGESAISTIRRRLNREIEWDFHLLLIQVLFFAGVFGACFFLFFSQIVEAPVSLGYRGSDMRGHLGFIGQYFEGKTQLPHPGMHIITYYFAKLSGLRLEYALISLLSIWATASAFAVYLILLKSVKRLYSPSFLLFITALLLLVSAIFAPFFNRHVYLFQGSPNVWHNPTLIAVKPFAFLALMLVVPFFLEARLQRKIGSYFLIAGTLLLSTWIKPNFVLSFLPALAIWIVLRYPKRLDLYWKSFVVVLPSLFYLALQYTGTYGSEPGRGIVFDFLGVWSLYSPNPWFSLALATAFPVLLTLFRFRNVMRDPYFLLCALNMVIATLQMMCLAESGRFYSNANFAWGYMLGLSLIFTLGMVKYLEWVHTTRTTVIELAKITVVTVALSLHVISGIYYTGKIWGGWNYH